IVDDQQIEVVPRLFPVDEGVDVYPLPKPRPRHAFEFNPVDDDDTFSRTEPFHVSDLFRSTFLLDFVTRPSEHYRFPPLELPRSFSFDHSEPPVAADRLQRCQAQPGTVFP